MGQILVGSPYQKMHSERGASIVLRRIGAMSTAGNKVAANGITILPVQGNDLLWFFSRGLIEVAVLGVLYYSTAYVGLQFSIPPGNASAVWPASGIALAALILRSRAIFPGIWLGAFIANSQTDVSFFTAALFATGNTASAILAASLCKSRLRMDRLFYAPSDALVWLFAASVSCGLAASCGAASLYLGGYIGPDQSLENWLTWWLGDLTGVMILAPALISIRAWKISMRLLPRRLLEFFLAFCSLILIGQFLFGGWLPESTAEGLLYLPMIVLLWLLLRFGLEAVLAGNVLIACLAVWGTSQNAGAFATEAQLQSLLDLQVFLNLYAVTGLILSGIRIQGRESERRRLVLDAEVQANHAQMFVANKIQCHLFPPGPLRGENYICDGIWQPAEVASADYFDFIPQPDGSVVLIIADVSGHGVGPALIMAETRAYVRALISHQSSLPEKLCRLNGFLYEDTETGRFVTLALCRFDPQTCEIEFVGAGHGGLLIRADGSCERLSASTIPLGLLSELPWIHPTNRRLNRGDFVFLYTDGFVESRLADGSLYGRERLIEILLARREDPVEKLLRVLVDDVARLSQQGAPRDDQAAVILRLQ